MDYREDRPAPPLRPFLECFWFLSAEDASGAPPESVLPDGCTELIIHLGEPFRHFDDAGASEAQPGAFFVDFSRHFVAPERLAALFDVGFVQDSVR